MDIHLVKCKSRKKYEKILAFRKYKDGIMFTRLRYVIVVGILNQ